MSTIAIYQCPQCQLPASTVRVELCPVCRKSDAPVRRPIDAGTTDAESTRAEVELAGGVVLLLTSFVLFGIAVGYGFPQLVETALWVFQLGTVPFLTGLIQLTRAKRYER